MGGWSQPGHVFLSERPRGLPPSWIHTHEEIERFWPDQLPRRLVSVDFHWPPCGFHIRSCVEFVNQIMCAGSRGSLYSSKLPSWIISSLNKGFVYGAREIEQIIFARSIIYLLKVVF